MQKNNHSSSGFTLIEMAIVLVVIGLLIGGGSRMITVLTHKKFRNENKQYLVLVKQSLLSFAEANGRLPWADTTGDGNSNVNQTRGTLPFLTLGIQPVDAYSRVINYAVNNGLGTNNFTTCTTIKGGIAGFPQIIDTSGGAGVFPVAAVIMSGGNMDADGAGGSVLDATAQGNNVTGNPNYILDTPSQTFDDMGLFINGWELFAHLCDKKTLTIHNSTANIIYLWETTTAANWGSVSATSDITITIPTGSTLELRDVTNGGGTIQISTPTTPLNIGAQSLSLQVP